MNDALEHLEFSHLLIQCQALPKQKQKLCLFSKNNHLKENSIALKELRNAVMHNKFLLLYRGYNVCYVEGVDDGKSASLKANILNLIQFLPKKVRLQCAKDINACKDDRNKQSNTKWDLPPQNDMPPKTWTKDLEAYTIMKKTGRPKTKYSPEFKLSVILDMREHRLSRHETVRRHWGVGTRAETDSLRKTVRNWERRYLEEGEAGLMEKSRERTARTENPDAAGQEKKPLPAEADNDLAAENRRLKERLLYAEAEVAYLKKLDALVRAEEGRSGGRP